MAGKEIEIVQTISGGLTFQAQELVFGQRVGITTDPTSTTAIQAAIDALSKVPNDLTSILDSLFAPQTKPPYGYDPSVNWLVGIALIYGVSSFDVLLIDGEFYGVLIKVGKQPPPPPVADQVFEGLSLEILYRKINDHLGEFSADLTLPRKYRKFKYGKPTATATITLPAIGIAIWTNGDFKVSLGWPLGGRSFNITFPPDPIPWAGGGGLYIAKLRSEDAPNLGTGYDTIIEFGLGIRIGAYKEDSLSIIHYEASLYLFGSFQGMLAWLKGNPVSGGVDYFWFCATIGIQGSLEGMVNFVIIKVTIALEIVASASLAIETGHKSTAQLEFKATVKASVKIVFFTISFSFSLDLTTSTSFGSGPDAKITGPSPPTQLAAAAVPELVEAPAAPAAITAPTPIALDAHLLLQPSIRRDAGSGAWKPVAVATLVLDRPPVDGGSPGLGSDGFSQLVGSLAGFLFERFGGYGDPTQPVTADQVKAVVTAIDGGQLDLGTLYGWMNAAQISFAIAGAPATLAASTPHDDVEGVLLPIIPGLELTYDGATTTFGDAAPPAGYLQVLSDYFAKLGVLGDGKLESIARVAADVPPPSPSWFPGLLFADAFDLLGKQLAQDVGAVAVPGTLAADLAQLDVANLAGTLSRFLQHGGRLPDPAASEPIETMPTLALYELTGQQLDIADDDKGNPILTAQLAVGTAPVAVTISGGGSAGLDFALDQAPESGPLWTPAPLERIRQVPVSYLLHQGFGWAQQTSSGTSHWLLFDFPDPLQAQLRLTSPLSLELVATDGDAGSQTPAPAVEAVMIRFALAPVPPMGSGDKLAGKVFRVAGPDEATRDLIELLFASGDLTNAQLDLLLPLADGSYATSLADAGATILRTDLSTAGGPALTALFADALQERAHSIPIPALGPTSATLSSPTDFLRLLWECSVVHSAGFYLYAPDLVIASGALSYQVAVLVTSASSTPAPTVTVDAQHTTLLMDAAEIPTGYRVQAALTDSGGTPLSVPQPAYAAGALAFQATWSASDTPPVPSAAVAADSAAYAAALYHMLQFQLPGDSVIEPSPWSMPLGPDGDDTTWSYRRAVPVQRFVRGAGTPPNRYAAIGHATTLDLALVDVFGNAMALEPLVLMPVYNDALIGLDQWPGAVPTYRFAKAAAGSATLEVDVSFHPEQIEEKATALGYYQVIHDQLTDARTSIAFTTALAADPVAMATAPGVAAQAALAALVAQVIAYLDPTVAGPEPDAVVLSGAVTTSYVTQIEDDMFPIWATIELTRDAPSEQTTYPYPPGFLDVSTPLPLLLDDTADATAALRDWSGRFEDAFAGFDGGTALLKVLAGSPPAKVTATASRLGHGAAGDVASVPGNVWGLRWTADLGVAVDFPNADGIAAGAPVYFTAMPLSTQLVGGVVDLYGYDATGNRQPEPTPTTFSGVDLDGLANAFLSAVDGLLAPGLATAIARLSPTSYDALMTAKEDLAFAIASGVSWVFADQMPSPLQAGAGDLGAAQTCLRDSLLGALGADFGTAAIAQVPATVAVHGQFEPEPGTMPPELFGIPTPIPPVEDDDKTLKQYTISSATLPVVDGPAPLSFLVSTVNPTTEADLRLDFHYDIAFLDHRFQTSEEQYGYVPSSWLRFVLPDVDPGQPAEPALDVPMGGLDIPIPLRAFPSPPRLVRQSIDPLPTPPATLSDAVQCSYSLIVGSPSAAQDDLHLAVLFNGAEIQRPAPTRDSGPLLVPLARFADFQARYLATATQAIETGDATAAQWCADVVALVGDVAAAWPVADSELEEEAMAVTDAPTPPLPWIWQFRLQVPDETQPGALRLDWIGTDEQTPPAGAWPTINGATGVPFSPTQMDYTLDSGDLTQPTLVWGGLSAITAQSISTAAWIVRNEELAGDQQDRTTNPGLVYSTATVSFPQRAVPLLEVPGTITISSSSLADALGQLVAGVMSPTEPAAEIGWGVETGYEYALVSGDPGQMRAGLPAFLARARLSTADEPPAGVETIPSLSAAMVGELTTWHDSFKPAATSAALAFSVTVFAAGGNQPLVRLLDVEAPISGSAWWPSHVAARR